MTVTVREITEVNDEAYVPDRSISDRKVLEDLLRISQVLRTMVAYLKYRAKIDADNERTFQLLQYEVATFAFPGQTAQGNAKPRKLYFFVDEKRLAFWAPERTSWVQFTTAMA